MEEYVKRLMACGYSMEYARQLCLDFSHNLHLFDLDHFVLSMEKEKLKCGSNITQIQPEEKSVIAR